MGTPERSLVTRCQTYKEGDENTNTNARSSLCEGEVHGQARNAPSIQDDRTLSRSFVCVWFEWDHGSLRLGRRRKGEAYTLGLRRKERMDGVQLMHLLMVNCT